MSGDRATPASANATPPSPGAAAWWENRYQEGRTRWDLGGPTPSFVSLLEGPDAPAPGAILVPGCGRGYDVLLFARHGFDAVGVDFAPSAISAGAAMAKEAGLEARARFQQADIFALSGSPPAAYDYVLERACYCAIDPSLWDRYVDLMAALLKPGGRLFGEFFLGPQDRPGPPFATTRAEIGTRFGRAFSVERMDPPHSGGVLPGEDVFCILARRS